MSRFIFYVMKYFVSKNSLPFFEIFSLWDFFLELMDLVHDTNLIERKPTDHLVSMVEKLCKENDCCTSGSQERSRTKNNKIIYFPSAVL